MKFSTRRVAILGDYGIIRRVHPLAARAMIEAKQAMFEDAQSIRLCGGLSTLPRSERQADRPSTSSIQTTWRQRMTCGTRLIQHKPIEVPSLYGLRV